MVTFNSFTFPAVQTAQITNAHEEIERAVPMRTVAYRVDRAELGRTVRLDGEIRVTSLDTLRETIDEIRGLADGSARSLDLEDGTAIFNALLADPEYSLDADKILLSTIFSADGRFRVPYSVTLLEVA
jgi:hypothetical protein